jgi:cytosine deaminase
LGNDVQTPAPIETVEIEWSWRAITAMKDPDVQPLLNSLTPVDEAALLAIAHMPTPSLASLMDDDFAQQLDDHDRMRIAVLLAEKSLCEGGCPIGAVIVDNASGWILGKGHNTLVQEAHPYNHGETAAIRDAGRIDFSQTTLYTSLSPCDICTSLISMRGFPRVVVGDITNAAGNESRLRDHGIQVDILEDARGVDLYARYRRERPELDLEDWQGLAAVHRRAGKPPPA